MTKPTGRPRGRPRKGINPKTGRKVSPPIRYGTQPEKGSFVRELWADPERREELIEKLKEAHKRRKEQGSTAYRLGTPDGMRRDEAEREWKFARMYAAEVTRIMKEENLIPEDPKVESAFKAAVEVLEGPMSQALKLQAARLILDFCKAKPVAKSEVTVKSAEDWLAQVTSDHLKRNEE